MKKIFEIARWEYLEKIRTKTFLISIIATPIIIILFSIIPILLAQDITDSTKIVGILANDNFKISELNKELSVYKTKNDQPAYIIINLDRSEQNFVKNKLDADNKLKKNEMYGYFIIKNFNTKSLCIDLFTTTNWNESDIIKFQTSFNNIRIKNLLITYNIDPDTIGYLSNNVTIKKNYITDDENHNQNFASMFYSSIVYLILLTFMIIYSGQMLVRSLLEEKSNRLIEIIISSCKPEELLSGKIIGLVALGLTQMFFWIFVGIILLGIKIIPAGSFHNITFIVIYFLLGYFLYSSILIGAGSIVTTEQGAQQITSYLSMILIIPIIIVIPAMQNPESLLIKILTYFPLTLPSVMIIKLNIYHIQIIDVVITLLIMILSIFLTIKISARIFKSGILNYVKVPEIKEIKNWLSTP